MIVDDYYYESPTPLSVEVYDDQDVEHFVAEVGDRLRLMRGSRDAHFLYNPKSKRALGGLSGEEERLLLAGGYSDRDLEITVTDRDADHEHNCNRYCVRISVVDGSNPQRSLVAATARGRAG